jgi:glycosyltransferase involved in cell wall biosynthesis
VKLAFLDDRHSMVYGAQENMLLLAAGCQALGHDVVFVTTADGVLADAARGRGLPVTVVPAPARLLTFDASGGVGGVRALLRTALDTWRYGWALADRLIDAQFDVVTASAVRPGTMLVPLRLRRFARRRPAVVLYAQNSTPFGAYAAAAGLAADRIALISDGARPTFPRVSRRLLAGRMRALPSGRDTAPLAAVAAARGATPREASPVVLCVATIEERKGLHDLLTAAAIAQRSVGPVVVQVVGGVTSDKRREYADGLVRQADDLGVDLRLEGWHDDVLAFYAAADLFVLASRDEGLPGVLLEALGTGLPCVATSAGGAGDLVAASGGGRAVAVGDTDALAREIVGLLRSPDDWAAASASGSAHVCSRYGLDAFVRTYGVIIDEVAGRG